MNRQEILINYKKVVEQADRLEEAGRKLDEMRKNECWEAIDELGSVWTGDVSASYIRKMQMLNHKLMRTALDLTAIAVTVRRKAERLRDADLKALEIAQARAYNGSGGGFSRGGGGNGAFGGGSGGGGGR